MTIPQPRTPEAPAGVRARAIPLRFTWYVGAVIAAGAAVLLAAALRLHEAWDGVGSSSRSTFLLLAVLLVAAELRPLTVHRRGGIDAVSLSGAFACALLLEFDWALVVVVQAVASLVDDGRDRVTWWKTAFNVGQYAIALAAAGALLELGGPGDAPRLVLAVGACAVFFVLNTALTGIGFALRERTGIVRSLLEDLPFQAAVNGVVIAMAPLVVAVANDSLWLVALLVVPVVAVHRGARSALDRRHMSRHDPLTGLLNHVAFREQVQLSLQESTAGEHVAVLVVSLDHFSDVNHTLGHSVGDDLLRQVAERLRTAVPEGAVLARVAAGGFLVAVPALGSPAGAGTCAETLLKQFSAPYALAQSEFSLRASIGMTVAPLHGTDAEQLVQHAEVACDVARRSHTGVEVYSAERNEFTDRRLAVLGGLGPALRRREMEVHFQPQVELRTGTVTGYEALLRWRHPTLGVVAPDEFVALAEHAGMMHSITEYVLDESLRRLAEWRQRGCTATVSVNVSASVLQDRELPARVARRLALWGVPSSALVLELTETAVMSDPERCRQVMNDLRALHVGLSLDDYGTGYASLTALTSLPIDELKIDKGFITGMVSNRTDRVVVRSTLQLARQLGLRVVAEGVETEELAVLLASYGCQTAQGYHYGRAVPPQEVVLDLTSVGHETAETLLT